MSPDRLRSIRRGVLTLLLVAVVYEALARSGWFAPALMPTLEKIAGTLVAVLADGSMLAHAATTLYRVLFGFLYGHVLTELQEVVERPEETDDVLRLGLHRLTITEFPQVRGLASALGSDDGAAELDRGLDLLFIGLTATVPPPDGSPAST